MFQVAITMAGVVYHVTAFSQERADEIVEEVSGREDVSEASVKTWCPVHQWADTIMGCCLECFKQHADAGEVP